MTRHTYRRVIASALHQPWALTEEYLAIVQDLLVFRARGGRLTADEIRARIGDADEDDAPRDVDLRAVAGGNGRGHGVVAVVPVYGVIAHRTFEASSGMTSAEGIGRMLRRAVDDAEVTAVLLDVSSPGGSVEGVPELADEILAARAVKPIVAMANAQMASAAYWLGTQAHEVVVTPSGEAGSIGVYGLHEDWSGWLEKEGVKVTALSAGDRKLEGAPWAPLDEEARAHFQARVDMTYRQFVQAVARGRGVTSETVREQFGQGRVFDAREAVKRGMADRVATFDETVARLARARLKTSTGVTPAASAWVLEYAEDAETVIPAEARAVMDPRVADADLTATTLALLEEINPTGVSDWRDSQ